MKPSTHTSKEVLPTQGEWKTNYEGSAIWAQQQPNCLIVICKLDPVMESAKANADLIVKAVNERQKLLTEIADLHKLVAHLTKLPE